MLEFNSMENLTITVDTINEETGEIKPVELEATQELQPTFLGENPNLKFTKTEWIYAFVEIIKHSIEQGSKIDEFYMQHYAKEISRELKKAMPQHKFKVKNSIIYVTCPTPHKSLTEHLIEEIQNEVI